MKYKTIRKYIGPVELVILIVIVGAVAVYLDRREKRQQYEQQLKELLAELNQPVTSGNPGHFIPDFTPKKEFLKNADNPHFKIVDSIYAPFAVDSLCRYTDANGERGFLTFTKQAPFYRDLCSSEKEYIMWVVLDKYFPYGEMLTITSVAENDSLIQFHFKRSDKEQSLSDVITRMDSLIQKMNSYK